MTMHAMHGQLPQTSHYKSNEKKAINTLIGLCQGVLTNGSLTNKEIHYLRAWLHMNARYLRVSPLSEAVKRIETIVTNGVVTEPDRTDLYWFLSEVVGGAFRQTENARKASTRLTVDKVDTIRFVGSSFCFAGRFIFGLHRKCQEAVIKKGGTVQSNITQTLNYLVVGELASRDWISTTHGTKIQKALDYKQSGTPITIISEKIWVEFI